MVEFALGHNGGPPLAPESEKHEEPLTYDIPEAGAMAGLGRNASYEAARRGEIPTIALGRKKRVPARRWRRILDGDAA
jgi:hypothetical protein